MLRIRLSRTGKKRQPSYRVVVADVESKRDGRIVERIGYYNPLIDPVDCKIEEARALYWLSVGAQPSDAVRRLLEKQGTYGRLARLHDGESFDALVAEYEGKPMPAPAPEVEASATAPTVVAKPVAEAEPVAGVEAEIEPLAESSEGAADEEK